jgi:hypothetical protein
MLSSDAWQVRQCPVWAEITYVEVCFLQSATVGPLRATVTRGSFLPFAANSTKVGLGPERSIELFGPRSAWFRAADVGCLEGEGLLCGGTLSGLNDPSRRSRQIALSADFNMTQMIATPPPRKSR